MTSTPLFVDNSYAIQLAKNPKFHDRTKHINTKYHLIRHHVEAKPFHLTHCFTSEQIIDIFTKALGLEKFEKFKNATWHVRCPFGIKGGMLNNLSRFHYK